MTQPAATLVPIGEGRDALRHVRAIATTKKQSPE